MYRLTPIAIMAAFVGWGDCAATSGAFAAATPAQAAVAEVLSNVRQAIGWEQVRQHQDGIVVKGVTTRMGQESARMEMFTPRGQFLAKEDGPLAATSGFDGSSGWMTDFSGMSYVFEQSLDEFDEPKLFSWLTSGYWLDEQSGVIARILEEQSDDDRVVLSVRLSRGSARKWLVVDRATWLPKAICDPGNVEGPGYELDDYCEVMGFRYPHRILDRQDTQRAVRSTFEVHEVTKAPVFIQDPYKPPVASPSGATFDPQVPAEMKLKRGKDGHLLVHPSINGADLGWMALDTGASAIVVGPGAIEKGKLPALWLWKAGPAALPLQVGLRGCKSLELGPMTIADLVFTEMPLDSFLSSIGRNISGIIGYDFFCRAVVEVDIPGNKLSVHDPAGYDDKDVRWQPFFYYKRLPHIRCRFEGDREALFLLDLGSSSTVELHAPAVRHFRLLKGRKTSGVYSYGIGAQEPLSEDRKGGLAWFEIAGHRIERIKDVRFLRHGEMGAYTDRRPSGLIGFGVLSDFKLILDYPHKRIAFIRRLGEKNRPATTQETR